MKVIHQLIDYLQERGRLTPEQVEQLLARGYLAQQSATDLRALEGKIGQSCFFQVPGELDGPLWGTDVYTSDSRLAAACVHAGLLQPGESGVVKVTMLPSVPAFQGSTRHGVTSHPWTTGWPAAYRVELFRK